MYYQLTSQSLIPVDSKSTKFGFDRSDVYIVFFNCIKLTGSVLVFISFQKVCAGASYKKCMKHGVFLSIVSCHILWSL